MSAPREPEERRKIGSGVEIRPSNRGARESTRAKPQSSPVAVDVQTTLALRFANLFLLLYALDALVSIAAIGATTYGEPSALAWVQTRLSSWVVVLAAGCFPLLIIAPRLPAMLVAGLALSVFWLASGAAPIPLYVDDREALYGLLAFVQFGIALGVMAHNARRYRGKRGLFGEDASAARGFSIGHALRCGALGILVLLPLVAAYALVCAATWLEVGTEHFVKARLTGLEVSDRRYIRGDREVRLVAMMHLGKDETYRDLARSFVSEDTVVLEEGVSDDTSSLESVLSYEGIASALGLTAQRAIGDTLDSVSGPDDDRTWPVLRNADVDASAFSDETIEYLALAARVWSAERPWAAFLEMYEYGLEHPQIVEVFVRDVLELRNQHLLDELDRAIPEFAQVIVPWGALHMPEIEREVLKRGFELETETTRQIVAWVPLLARIL